MKKILFFTHKPISHLIPISDLMYNLISEGNIVYCLGYKERKKFIVDKGAIFIEYPEVVEKDMDFLISNIEKKEYAAYKDNNIDLGYQYYLEKNAIHMHSILERKINLITSIVLEIHPDVIFHDIVDLYAPIICNRYNIRRIDYITNPLYSRHFFENESADLYTILTRTIHFSDKMKRKYINNYWTNMENLYTEIEKKYGFISIPPLNQFEMNGEINLIFSTDCLQPPLDDNNYKIIPPSKTQFTIEDDVPDTLREFIGSKKNIMYVSQGSFLSEDEDFYIDLFIRLKNSNLNYIISCGKSRNIVEKVVKKMGIENNVFISEFIPQKYVLSKVDIFFSTGGFNSIMEAIYYKTPMIINPFSAEQRMNGYWTDKLGISKTLYSKDINFDLKKIVYEIINNPQYQNNMEIINEKLKKSIKSREMIIENITL